jgi:hypothetical protein
MDVADFGEVHSFRVNDVKLQTYFDLHLNDILVPHYEPILHNNIIFALKKYFQVRSPKVFGKIANQ